MVKENDIAESMGSKSPEIASSSSSKKAVNLEITEKVRVLCLHGYRQNADSFKSKIGSFRKFVGKYADLVFVTSPHIAPPLESGQEPVPEQRSWWSNKDDGSFKGTNKNGPAFGFQESLRIVEETWKKEGPFQGLLGFSQGACFVGLLCGLSKKKLTPINPQFAIMSSGFVSGSLAHKSAYESMPRVPTLHIYGLTDNIIPKEMSQELAAHFKLTELLEHSGGHYFPATAQQKNTYISFFQDRLQEHLERIELLREGGAEYLEVTDDGSDGQNASDD